MNAGKNRCSPTECYKIYEMASSPMQKQSPGKETQDATTVGTKDSAVTGGSDRPPSLLSLGEIYSPK